MTVEQLIDELDLKSKCRKRELVYTRYVLYKYLRKYNMTLNEIGKMFNRDHASVLFGLRQYDELNSNSLYIDFNIIKTDTLERLGLNPKMKPKAQLSNLESKLLSCGNYMDLKRLQDELRKDIENREDEIIFTTFDI